MSKILKRVYSASLLLPVSYAIAGPNDKTKTLTLGEIFNNLADYIADVSNLMTIVTVVAGFSFVIASFFKFKQVKDNPTQIPVGTPFALLGVGVVLIFYPSLIEPAAETFFGKKNIEETKEKCILPGMSNNAECKSLNSNNNGNK